MSMKLSQTQIDRLYKEANLLNVENIRKFPCSRTIREDYISMSSRFGRQAATDYIVGCLYQEQMTFPSEHIVNEWFPRTDV